jgi:hypothetical protein
MISDKLRKILDDFQGPLITGDQLRDIFADWEPTYGVKLLLVQAWKKGYFHTKANWWPPELGTFWGWIGKDGFHEREVRVEDHIRVVLELSGKFDDAFIVTMPMNESLFVQMPAEVRKQWFHLELDAVVKHAVASRKIAESLRNLEGS